MYVIHRTEGVVLSGVPVGEADRSVIIFTRDLGRVEAVATSARLERSRLRYALVPYTSGLYSFVRGRRSWRVVGARDETNYAAVLRGNPQGRAGLERFAALVSRLVAGEGKHEALFEAVASGMEGLSKITQEREEFEAWAVLRVLFILGYISTEGTNRELAPLVDASRWDDAVIVRARESKKMMIRAINAAIAASHL